MKRLNVKKRAFTLIELMAVVIILGVISTIVVTTINYTIRNSKEKLYNEQISRLETGVKEWSIKNTNLLPTDASGIAFFSIKRLKDDGIIGNTIVTNPLTNAELTGCLTITYDINYNQYKYQYIDDSCVAVSATYKPIITVTGGDTQFTEVNGVFSLPKVSGKDYTGKTLVVSGPTVKKGTQVVSTINTGTIGDQYTLTYKTTDTRLNLVTTKVVTATVRDTIAPVITVNGHTSSYAMNYETQATFTVPTATVTDNSCGVSGTDTTKNGCVTTLTTTNNSTVVPTVEGSYNVTYSATDSSGNVKFFILTVNITDTVAPSMPTYALKLNTSGGANYLQTWTNQNVWLGNLAATDIGSGVKEYQFSTDCNTNWTTISGATATYSTDTNTSYCIRAIDYSLNASSATAVIAIKVDKTTPSCISSGGSSTWTGASRTLTGTCSDAGSGCTVPTVTKGYSIETNSTTESPGSVTDTAGNTSVCPANQTVKIDKTAPSCASSGSNAAWINTSRTLTGTCTDTGSGCAAPTVTKLYNTNTNSAIESPGSVTDNVGLTTVCPATQTVKVDVTAPTCASSGTNAAWTNVSRTLTGTCSDTGGSGCSAATITKDYTTETNSTTESPGSVTDVAGNTGVCPATQTVKVDKTAPSCASSGTNAAWTNVSRTLTGTCSDTGSGCVAATVTKLYNTNTNSAIESPGSVTDNVGLTTVCPATQTVKVDVTAPTCASSGGNAAWIGTTRTLTGTCSDTGGSGCSAATITKLYNTNTNSAIESPGSVTDAAGNTGVCPATQTVKVDVTAPTCASSGGSAAWTNSLTLTGTCSDTGGSGCSTATVTKPYTTEINSTTETPGNVTDAAGNTGACPATQTVKIDTTAPTCASSGGSATWATTRTLTGTCSDLTSGCSAPTVTRTIITDTNSTTESPGSVTDAAGNTGVCPATQTVKVDATAPSCASSGGNAAWATTRTLTGTCTDTGSGCSAPTVTRTIATDINSTTESPGSVTDNVGRTTVCPATQTVKIDTIAPSCASSGGNAAWINTTRTLTGTCSDAGSGCSGNVTKLYNTNTNLTTESPGSVTDLAGNTGVCPANQTVKIDTTAPTCVSSGGNAAWVTSLTLTGTCSDTGGSGCSGNATKPYSTDINQTAESPGNITDIAGNTGVCPGNQTVKIDKTLPGITTIAGGNSVVKSTPSTITLTAGADSGSGVNHIEYSTDNTNWLTYSTPLTYTTTMNITVYARTVDNANNIGATASDTVIIDTGGGTPPGDTTGANAPVMDAPMIPVRWNGTKWVKAASDNTDGWYNYGASNWANVIITTTASRAAYQAAAVGTEVLNADALLYLVWIPRYKFAVNGTVAGPIDVVFETGTATTGLGTGEAAGSYDTHGGFTYNGGQLQGLWVGKFDTGKWQTGAESSWTTAAAAGGTVANAKLVLVKPSILSWRSLKMSVFYDIAEAVDTTTATYGITSASFLTRMASNLEWGSISFLSQSIYGKCPGGVCTDIWNNSTTSLISGCAGATNDASPIAGLTCSYPYNSINGFKASTTGNITGVYDMSGGNQDFTFGHLTNYAGSTGFTTTFTASAQALKNINKYTATNYFIGDAWKGPTAYWYGDDGTPMAFNSVNSWIRRGGGYDVTVKAGIFAFQSTSGASSANSGFRFILSEFK